MAHNNQTGFFGSNVIDSAYQGMMGSLLGNQAGSSLNQMQMQALQNAYQPPQGKPKERTMFQEVKNDVTTFIKEHRGVIYFIALALLVDHFIFRGVFKARLHAMLESLIGKVEAKVAAS